MSTISAGKEHSLVIDSQGRVWAFGKNNYRQLGLDDTTSQNIPTLIPNLPPAKSVSAGGNHSLVLDEQGKIWAFGSNRNGQLGLGSDNQYDLNILNIIPGLSPIKAISAGEFHSLLLDEQGQVWAVGNNYHGQLGLGDITARYTPTPIPNLPLIKAISTGTSHSLVLDQQGQVWAFGYNTFGQLGLRDIVQHNTPTPIPNLPPIKAISAGDKHSLVLDESGQVWGFGSDANSQLGLNNQSHRNPPTLIPNMSSVKAISVGTDYSLVLGESGQVWSFGYNYYGQLGLNNVLNQNIPTLNPYLHSIEAISAGGSHSLTIDQQGQVRTFGSNWFGYIGLGDNNMKVIPTIIPGLIARLPSIDEDISLNILTEYPVIEALMSQIFDFRIIQQKDNGDVLMEFETNDQTIYEARVRYDSSSDQILPPTQDESFFELLTNLIQTNQLTEYQARPDLYQDEFGNQGFEFTDDGQRYLIRVWIEDGQVYPPK